MVINFVLESEPEDKPKRKRFDDYPIHDLESWSKMPSISWLVDNLIPAQGTGSLYGPTGHYKSFVAISIAGCINTGTPLAGKKINKQGRSLFCLTEGFSGFGYRLRGWEQYHGDTPLLANFWRFPVDLSANQKVDELIERIRDAGIPDLRLIFIDTWIKSIGAIQTNSDIETIACIKNMERIAAAFNCFVFAIDYAGKDADRGLRGSSVKNQGVDVVIKVKAEDRDVSLFTEKLKEGDTTVLNHTFKVRQVEVKPPVGQEANEQWRIMDGNLRQTLVVDFGETKRKSCETKARDLFEDGLDEDMVRSQLKQEYSKAQVSKALSKIRNSDGNFQETN